MQVDNELFALQYVSVIIIHNDWWRASVSADRWIVHILQANCRIVMI